MKALIAVLGVAAVVLLGLAPLGINGYYLNLLYITILYVGLAYGWNIISGYAGYFSFGQITFFGIGAYATGLIIVDLHWYWVLASLCGGAWVRLFRKRNV